MKINRSCEIVDAIFFVAAIILLPFVGLQAQSIPVPLEAGIITEMGLEDAANLIFVNASEADGDPFAPVVTTCVEDGGAFYWPRAELASRIAPDESIDLSGLTDPVSELFDLSNPVNCASGTPFGMDNTVFPNGWYLIYVPASDSFGLKGQIDIAFEDVDGQSAATHYDIDLLNMANTPEFYFLGDGIARTGDRLVLSRDRLYLEDPRFGNTDMSSVHWIVGRVGENIPIDLQVRSSDLNPLDNNPVVYLEVVMYDPPIRGVMLQGSAFYRHGEVYDSGTRNLTQVNAELTTFSVLFPSDFNLTAFVTFEFFDRGNIPGACSNDGSAIPTPTSGGSCRSAQLVIGFYIANSNVIFVDQNAPTTGLNNGSNWINAFTDLQSALAVATSGTEIWVAEGTYKPTSGTDQSITFNIPKGVTIKGGFSPSNNAVLPEHRDWNQYPVIFSGDLNNSGMADAGDSHTIIQATNDTITLDGLVITHGYADNSSDNSLIAIGRSGAGMYNNGNNNIFNCVFKENVAFGNGTDGVGGALASFDGHLIVTNTLFHDNFATSAGGAVSPQLGSTEFINCTFGQNNANTEGGAVHTFSAETTMTNCIFAGNTAATNNHINNHLSMQATLLYSLLDEPLPVVGGGGGMITDGGNNILNTDPFFNDAPNGDFTLDFTSLALDAGDNGVVTLS